MGEAERVEKGVGSFGLKITFFKLVWVENHTFKELVWVEIHCKELFQSGVRAIINIINGRHVKGSLKEEQL